ncbi:hypothetical protein H0H87_002245, partial [Tephrocybe sp. NHM501043]
MGATTVWSRDAVAERILAGDTLVVCDGHLLRIPPTWLSKHPGGALAILHFVGRDASDEIHAYHAHSTLALIPRYAIGRVALPWRPLVPPVMSGWVRTANKWHCEALPQRSSRDTILLVTKHTDSSAAPTRADLVTKHTDSPAAPTHADLEPPLVTNHPHCSAAPTRADLEPPPSSLDLAQQARHSAAYKALHSRIIDAGLYNTPYLSGYGPELLRYTALAALSALAYHHSWFLTSALFLGLTWHQLVFTAHDLGHMGVTHHWVIDRVLSILIADYIGGLSIGWWVQNHNIHHIVTNHPSHDPDIEHLPFFAISPVFLTNLWSSYYKRTMWFDRFAKLFVAIQHKLFYLVMMFARFNLYANSYIYLFQKAFDTPRARGGRWAWAMEVLGIVFFWSWFGRVLYGCGSCQTALAYLLVSHAATSPLHVQ